MFCPKCGAAEQSVDSFCRSCGIYLPDIESIRKKEIPVSEHLNVNGVMSMMTIVVSFVLAATLYFLFFERADTHIVIYITTGFLIAIGCWNIQTFYRTKQLRKRLKGYGEGVTNDAVGTLDGAKTKLLDGGGIDTSAERAFQATRRTTQRLKR
jgi:hypothetical protein